MKKLFTLLGLLLTIGVQAQITLTNTGYTHLVGTDSTKIFDTANISVAALAVPHTAYTWDFTNNPYDPGGLLVQRLSPLGAFPGSSFGEVGVYAFAALSYMDTAAHTVGATGWTRIGESIGRQPISISALTFGPNDSVVFAAQNIVYAGGVNTRIKFPATYNSNWSSAFVINTAINLTVAAASLNNTPGIRRSYMQVKDTVIGWGNMKVKDWAGTVSGLNPVLQVKEILISTDSFFLAGTPASPTLLAAFGVSQGMVTTDYRILFYRQGETQPLTAVYYSDATMTKSRSPKFNVHTQRLNYSSGIPGIHTGAEIVIYPNPVVNRQIFIKLPGGNTAWSYELMSITGQKMLSIRTAGTRSLGSIMLPETLQAGIYYLRVQSDEGVNVIRPVSIQ